MIEAGKIGCPNCGVPVSGDPLRPPTKSGNSRVPPTVPGADAGGSIPACTHCGTRLATVSCSMCFGMMFVGTKFCPHCGSEGGRGPNVQLTGDCPRCDGELHATTVGRMPMSVCERCAGIWVDAITFDAVCETRAADAPVIDLMPIPEWRKDQFCRQRPYVKCPQCTHLMNRQNFARRSGVVVDVCRNHGLWLDHDEFRAIVEFILAGGLDHAARNQNERDRHAQAAERLQKMAEIEARGSEAVGFGGGWVEEGTTTSLVAEVIEALLRTWAR